MIPKAKYELIWRGEELGYCKRMTKETKATKGRIHVWRN